MLATDMAEVWTSANYEVVGLSHAEFDVTHPGQVRTVLEQTRPDVAIYTPGLGVDICETEPEKGYQLHTWAATMIGQQCQRLGAAFVYISTCGLFGDEVKFYSEYDSVQLKTHYARSKFLGEQAAVQACEQCFLIRPGWLFGGSPSHLRNFVFQRFLEAKQSPVIRGANDKFGCPTFTGDLALKILEVVESEQYGLYHLTNSGSTSRYEYVKFIVEAFGLTTTVQPVDSASFPRAAPVPDCEMLENLNLKFLGIQTLGPWQESVNRYVATLEKSIY